MKRSVEAGVTMKGMEGTWRPLKVLRSLGSNGALKNPWLAEVENHERVVA